MNIAILILAHNNENRLKELINSLKNDFRIFLHLDARCNISTQTFDNEKNVTAIKKHKIYWGSPSIVYATLDLLRLAVESGSDYFMLISGNDLPIRTCRSIVEEIERNPERNCIDYAPMPRPDWPFAGGLDRLRLFWSPNKEKEEKSLSSLFWGIIRNFQKITGLRRRLFPLKYFGGSEWFNISRETAQYVLDFTDNNPKFLNQFAHTLIADEIYFQTVIMNSPFASKVVNDDKRYIDWASGPERPRILRMEDLDKIKASGDFFARKTDEKVDADIIKELKSML